MAAKRGLIVGGGVGGMTAAIGLRRDGVSIDLVDKDPTWRALGAGLTLNGATLRAFEMLGIYDEVAAAGHFHGGRRVMNRAGDIIADVPAYQPKRGDLMVGGGILRPDLHRILSERTLAAGANVRLGTTVDSLDQGAEQIVAHFSDGTADTYDFVIGADGIMSSIRKMTFPEAPAPAFTGQGSWRAVFDRPADINCPHIYVDAGMKLGLNPVSDREMYMFVLESAPGNPWIDEKNWVSELRTRLMGYHGLPRELAAQLGPDSLINYRPLETLLLPPPWHVGRVALLGDAVHATTPHAGFGAGLAIEDGLALAEAIRAEDDIPAALAAYAARRYPRCKEIIEASLALGELELAEAPAVEQAEATMALLATCREEF